MVHNITFVQGQQYTQQGTVVSQWYIILHLFKDNNTHNNAQWCLNGTNDNLCIKHVVFLKRKLVWQIGT